MEDKKKGGITISQSLPAPIKQSFPPHLLTNPYCECERCEKANEWQKKITPESFKKTFEEE